MSVDLFCYVSLPFGEVNKTINLMVAKHHNIFHKNFLISSAREASAIHKEIALEFNLVALCTFIVSLNDKNSGGLVLDVVTLIKEAFGDDRVVVLHTNEVRI